MKGLIVVTLSLVAVAKCRPDVSLAIPSGAYLPIGQSHADYSSSFPSGVYGAPISEDQRHVYFYAGGEDLYSRLKINIVPTSHKNTKIIFVKAPSHQVVPEVIAPPSLTEDKTLVYVLVKKPQDGSITIPSGVGIKQTKPEVFFIKYNSKHDAASQVTAGAHGQQVGSSVPDVGSEGAFVNTLRGADAGGYGGNHGQPGASGPY
ncbi:uncharacterized protein LOC116177259 isoform X2 [Photinus pyralis]|uniref:uncharacterized protein LOC116177259 isoform X2 n=1 Tax=Photinus pyralis TaxID=7054 RepID=UPI0012673603|nr:uncharacterized protein LOC116177259 isoform X2 [Photinus pyralis]